MARTKLNKQQLDVLRRICDGQNPVTSDDDAGLASTVHALIDRGLITTIRTDGRWSTAPTEAGHQHLTQRDHQAVRNSPGSAASPEEEASQLIARLRQAGGTLSITNPSPEERARWRRAVHAARADHQIPDSHHLHYTGRDKGDLVIALRQGHPPKRTTPAAPAIHVPDHLPPGQLHFIARDAPLPVCVSCQPRARRILHALCLAAENNGLTPVSPQPDSAASLALTTPTSSFPLILIEGSYQAPDPTSVKYTWQRVTAHTTHPSHQLDLNLGHSYAHPRRRSHWGDRQRWRLEDKLPHLLNEVIHRATAEKERDLARQCKEEETRERWQAVMAQARTRFIDDHRQKTLQAQVQAWQKAATIRAYCHALEDHQTNATPRPSKAATEWIVWARSFADRIDPVAQSPEMPDLPAIKPEDLHPYLQGWSPYEPKRT